MPASKRPGSGSRRSREPEPTPGSDHGDPPGEPPGEEPPLTRNPDADPVRIHREYVQRRLGGGALPTPEAYENALDEWHRLSGAVRGPAGEVHPETQRRRVPHRGEAEPAEEQGDQPPPEETAFEGPLPATDPGENEPYTEGRR